MTILQALDRYYDRMDARGEVVAPGWSIEPIGLLLELAEDGSLLTALPRRDDKGKPRPERVPKWFTRSGSGSTPNFLWDNAAYALGIGNDNKKPEKTARDHAAFKELHVRELAGDPDAGLLALCRFLRRWTPDQAAAHGLTEESLTSNIGFRLHGEQRFIHCRPAASPHIDRLRLAAAAAGEEGFCLVRGARLPLVRLHPKVKGIDGAASAEIPLVSFNRDAFTSYGKEQGFNAPTSEAAAFRYGAALNALLRRGGRNRMRLADATVTFWADASALDGAAEANAAAAEDMFAYEFADAPPPTAADEVQQAASVRGAVRKVAVARAEQGVRPDLVEGVAFHVLGLAPNAARVTVRFWLSNSFREFAKALDAHAEALAMDPPPWRTRRPKLQFLLLKTTALQEKFENIPAGLAAEVARAVLARTPYPRAWLAAAIMRLRAGDDPAGGWHAAAAKACLSRMPKEDTVPTGLDPDNPNPAYQLGRLFAVLQAAQTAALGHVNATITDRYYGAASATPALVFGALMRGARNHISDARKRGRGLWVERRLEEILGRLSSDLPRTLRLEDQGRFAIGYYHERAFRPARPDPETDGAADAAEKDAV